MKSSPSKSCGISQQVYRTLGKYLRTEPESLHPEDSLRDDLGLDSLQTIELVYEVESAFDLQIPDEDFGRLTTIGDVILYLHERTQATDGASPMAHTHSPPPQNEQTASPAKSHTPSRKPAS